MRALLVKLAAIGLFSVLSVPAVSQAATTVVDGSCSSVTASSGCLFKGNINTAANGNNSYLNAQSAYNLYNNTHPSANPDITLTPIVSSDDPNFDSFGSTTGAGATSGTWMLDNFIASYFAVKAGNNFVLYALSAPASSGTWDTFDLPGILNGPNAGQSQNLSHLTFFGSPVSGVPEPSTWAMMILGMGAVGWSLRQKRVSMGKHQTNFA
ncbi:hypothetical protein HNO88_003669 [Novosphingobium chloroacetimidivorans]|uniref:Ice-binding protein C-terminal domain-containing protein n=1 Tax=Novosphingobium chloroacetimidivorans TaxID=1428314 RepID=A0A7W7KDB9_9SPHN|nr:PEPxxWA-CTERM sorting domain-containing protein [Novosphingobium chloroacetimidivorans]MBB4860326.1 hypothetical protein [Novosphingobium chloroacetimidivorans]